MKAALCQLKENYTRCNKELLKLRTEHLFNKAVSCALCDLSGLHDANILLSHFLSNEHQNNIKDQPALRHFNKSSLDFWIDATANFAYAGTTVHYETEIGEKFVCSLDQAQKWLYEGFFTSSMKFAVVEDGADVSHPEIWQSLCNLMKRNGRAMPFLFTSNQDTRQQEIVEIDAHSYDLCENSRELANRKHKLIEQITSLDDRLKTASDQIGHIAERMAEPFNILRDCEDPLKRVTVIDGTREIPRLRQLFDSCNKEQLEERTNHLFTEEICCDVCGVPGLSTSNQVLSHLFEKKHINREIFRNLHHYDKEAVEYWIRVTRECGGRHEEPPEGFPRNQKRYGHLRPGFIMFRQHSQKMESEQIIVSKPLERAEQGTNATEDPPECEIEKGSDAVDAQLRNTNNIYPDEGVDPFGILRDCVECIRRVEIYNMESTIDQLRQSYDNCEKEQLNKRTKHLFTTKVRCGLCFDKPMSNATHVISHVFKQYHLEKVMQRKKLDKAAHTNTRQVQCLLFLASLPFFISSVHPSTP
ncbi:hypothetical protein PMAYCL1PPCAC_08177 [Pristionchus mayeri]|uniref:Uncharacterized protein n=1 Tax=Pristionchus mayeri TaxID=1317129 RepID=A0AAN5CC87_9BILA|nr:hypothetical protein PMAYCL1PPCAC_08177 [Pristionchus mayeri]